MMRNLWAGAALVAVTAAAIALVAAGSDERAAGFPAGERAAAARTDNPAMVSWSAPIEVAAGEAYQGPWRMNESDFRYVDAPTVAVSADGTTGVAWVDQATKDVLYQVYDAAGTSRFARPPNVSRSPDTFSWLPRIAFGRGGAQDVYALWQEIVFSGGSHGGEIFFARSTDGGQSFGEPVNLSNTPAGAGKGRLNSRRWDNGSLDLAVGAEGELFAAWTEYEGRLWLRRSSDGGASFEPPVRIAGDGAEPARGPALAVGRDGAVHVAWTVGDDPAADIRLASSDDGGRSFGAPRSPATGGGHADAPKLAVDDAGTLHLVYAESPDGPMRRYHLLHARSTDGGPSFEAPRRVSGLERGGSGSASFPALDIDDAGNLYLVWELAPDARQRPQGLAFAVSTDGGRSFSPGELVPGTTERGLGFNGSLQGLLMRKLAVNGAGEIAIVNSSFQPGDVSRVRLIRGRLAGR